MTLALVLVIAAQIGTPKLKNCSVTDIINPDVVCNRATGQWVSCLGKQAHPACWCRWNDAKCFYRHESPKLPISTRRVEPLVVRPESDVLCPPYGNGPCNRELGCGSLLAYPHPCSEPFDVPAVQKEYVAWTEQGPCHPVTDRAKADIAKQGWSTDNLVQCETIEHKGTRWTCPDPRRVLLTAENGTRHCVLFEGAR